MRVQRLLGFVLVPLVLATGCSLSKSGKEFPSTPPAGSASGPVYVALGDSYSTGGGIGTSTGRCLRSPAGYPALVAAALGIGSFDNETCGGATTGDLTEQMASVSPATTLVTVGVGTNDDGLATRIGYTCLRTKGRYAPDCATYLQTPQSELRVTIGTLASRVRAAITAVQAAAPNAQVVLIGYPRMFPDSGSCPARYPLKPEAVDRLRVALAEVNHAWRQVAQETGATYVDTYAASLGHDICSSDPWINGIKPRPGDGAALHPNGAYHQAVAKLVEAAVA